MQILITGGNLCSENRGINAITLSTINFLKKKNPNSKIILLARNSYKHQEIIRYERELKIKIIEYTFMILLINYLLCIISSIFTILKDVLSKHIRIIHSYTSSDYVIAINEGDSFTDNYPGISRFLSYYALMDIAILLRKKLILNPQTIGPFSTLYGRICSKRVLKHSTQIFVREKISEKIIRKINKEVNLITTHDMAFLMEKKKNDNLFSAREYIGLNISGLLWDSDNNLGFYLTSGKNYKKKINFIIDYLIQNTNYEIILIPHTYNTQKYIKYDDYKACLTCKQNFQTNRIKLIDAELDCQALKGIISNSKIFIGSRMHSCIAALSSNVPTITIGYSHKYRGILKNSAIEGYDISHISDEKVISSIINQTIQNSEKIRQTLMKKNILIKKNIEQKYFLTPKEAILNCIKNEKNQNCFIPKNINFTVSLNLCTGCGMCYSICPTNAIELNYEDLNIPNVNNDKCIGCKKCIKICPPISKVSEEYPGESIYGKIVDINYGFSNNSNIRYISSSGGIIRSIIQDIVENQTFDFVISIIKNSKNPFEPIVKIIQSQEDFSKLCNSLYYPTSVCSIFHSSLKIFKNKKICLIGKPCEITAIKLAQKYTNVFKDSNLLTISIFCYHTPSRSGTFEYINRLKIPLENVAQIGYRGLGWPGYFQLKLRSGEIILKSYKESWKYISNKKYNHSSCKYCSDPTGKHADLSCGDAWGYTNKENTGLSIVFVRTQFGKNILKNLLKKKKITLIKENNLNLINFQPNLSQKIISNINVQLASQILNFPRISVFEVANMEALRLWENYCIIKKLLFLISGFLRFNYKAKIKTINGLLINETTNKF